MQTVGTSLVVSISRRSTSFLTTWETKYLKVTKALRQDKGQPPRPPASLHSTWGLTHMEFCQPCQEDRETTLTAPPGPDQGKGDGSNDLMPP